MEKIFISETGPEVSAAIYGFWRWNTAALANQKKIEDIIKILSKIISSSKNTH